MDRLRWFLSRLRGLVQPRRHVDALDDELRFHLEEEAERLMATAYRPTKPPPPHVDRLAAPSRSATHTRDVWTFPRLEQVWRDIAYGWRQITKAKVRSAAAILSLALAVGACLTTFVVMDALLFRPLPVRDAERLHVMFRESHGADGPPRSFDGVEYPLFLRMRAAISGATLLGVSYAAPKRHLVWWRSGHREGHGAVRLGRPLHAVRIEAGCRTVVDRRRQCSRRCAPGGRDQRLVLDAPLRPRPGCARPACCVSVHRPSRSSASSRRRSRAPNPASSST